MKLTLIEKKKIAGNITSFVFKPEKKLNWIAGQYLIYTLEHINKDLRGKQRFFTISSSPFENYPTITTRFFGNSASSFKKALSKMKIGDQINAKGPDGDFVLENMNKEYVFIAGGIGITPFISILRQLDFEKKKMNITLLYSNKNKQVAFKKELEEITTKNLELKINYIFFPKKIDKPMLKKYLSPKTVFYISGPDPMVDSVFEILKDLKVKKDNIKMDYFSGYKKI